MFNSKLKKNIGANFAGSVWQSLMALAFVPLYIKFMGIEAYGLIGIFATLQAIFGLLDIGLGSTLNREMARLSVLPNKEQEMRNLVRTMELIYWAIAVFAGIAVVLLSPYIAHNWLQGGQLSPEVIEQAILVMGFVMVFQMPIGFYAGGLLGLQEQVLLNVINSIVSTLRGVGALLVLWLISPTIKAFLLWQIISSIVNVFLLAFFLSRKLPGSENKGVFQKKLLNGIWSFAAGMSGISILAVILTQLDKVILSKLLSLEMFGHYMLASVVAASLGKVFIPVFMSIYPRFTQLATANNHDELRRLYHKSSQFIAVLVLPAAIVIAFFSYEVMLLWTQNPSTAEQTYHLVSILICGTAINGLMYIPYALQLAFGWTKLSFFKTLIAVILLVPLNFYMALHYGAKGAASVWLILHISMFTFEVPIMHRRLLRQEMWLWYWQDVSIPLIAAFSVAGLGRLFFTTATSHFTILLNLIIVSFLTFGITATTTLETRQCLFAMILKNRTFRKVSNEL